METNIFYDYTICVHITKVFIMLDDILIVEEYYEEISGFATTRTIMADILKMIESSSRKITVEYVFKVSQSLQL